MYDWDLASVFVASHKKKGNADPYLKNTISYAFYYLLLPLFLGWAAFSRPFAAIWPFHLSAASTISYERIATLAVVIMTLAQFILCKFAPAWRYKSMFGVSAVAFIIAIITMGTAGGNSLVSNIFTALSTAAFIFVLDRICTAPFGQNVSTLFSQFSKLVNDETDFINSNLIGSWVKTAIFTALLVFAMGYMAGYTPTMVTAMTVSIICMAIAVAWYFFKGEHKTKGGTATEMEEPTPPPSPQVTPPTSPKATEMHEMQPMRSPRTTTAVHQPTHNAIQQEHEDREARGHVAHPGTPPVTPVAHLAPTTHTVESTHPQPTRRNLHPPTVTLHKDLSRAMTKHLEKATKRRLTRGERSAVSAVSEHIVNEHLKDLPGLKKLGHVRSKENAVKQLQKRIIPKLQERGAELANAHPLAKSIAEHAYRRIPHVE
jgi:hypothetical protein